MGSASSGAEGQSSWSGGQGAKPPEAKSLLDFRGPKEGTKFDNYCLQAVQSESLLTMESGWL